MPPDTIQGVNVEGSVAAESADELFPASERVVYKANTLVSVRCQLRFPAILRIDAEPPAAFQEIIRSEYPQLRDRSADLLQVPPEIPAPVAQFIRSAVSSQAQRTAYDFASEDGKWTVSLNREFLALTTTDYPRWEEFRKRLNGPLDALLKTYSPGPFTRIGLRYQNVIRRSRLGLANERWGALLEPHVIGMLGSEAIDRSTRQAMTQTLIQFPKERGNVNIRYGLAQEQPSGELCYLIDNDFFTDKSTGAADVYTKLDFFNQQSGRLFRWCIGNGKLHLAMGPQPHSGS
jgi:uncharacterized protein (TIGR04255 family)